MLMPILLALSTGPQVPVEVPPPKRGPSMQFVTDTVDLGVISDQWEVEWEFRFKNTGDEDLVFVEPIWAPVSAAWSWGPFESDIRVHIGPRIEVEYDTIDLGPMSDEGSVEWVFFFTNVGDVELEVISSSPWHFADPVPGAARVDDAALSIGPRIMFYSDTIDLGVINDEREVPWEFHFANTGDEVLEIEVDRGSDGGTVPLREYEVPR